jgi:hypothetical protein
MCYARMFFTFDFIYHFHGLPELPPDDKDSLPLPVSQGSAVYNACKMSLLGLLTTAFESKVSFRAILPTRLHSMDYENFACAH